VRCIRTSKPLPSERERSRDTTSYVSVASASRVPGHAPLPAPLSQYQGRWRESASRRASRHKYRSAFSGCQTKGHSVQDTLSSRWTMCSLHHALPQHATHIPAPSAVGKYFAFRSIKPARDIQKWRGDAGGESACCWWAMTRGKSWACVPPAILPGQGGGHLPGMRCLNDIALHAEAARGKHLPALASNEAMCPRPALYEHRTAKGAAHAERRFGHEGEER
jgi:hypothetical protein